MKKGKKKDIETVIDALLWEGIRYVEKGFERFDKAYSNPVYECKREFKMLTEVIDFVIKVAELRKVILESVRKTETKDKSEDFLKQLEEKLKEETVSAKSTEDLESRR